jgi:peroxiredoxin-like protein
MSQIHEYPITVNYAGGRTGSGHVVAERTDVTNVLVVPPEFGGTGTESGTNPEELLTAAITGCYSITFSIVADARKLPVVNIETKAVGEVEQPNAATFIYKKVTLKPTITMTADATDDQLKVAEEMAHKADAYCIVTNAVRGKVEIVVEPTVVRA